MVLTLHADSRCPSCTPIYSGLHIMINTTFFPSCMTTLTLGQTLNSSSKDDMRFEQRVEKQLEILSKCYQQLAEKVYKCTKSGHKGLPH